MAIVEIQGYIHGLFKQQGIDIEMLKELGMADTTSYAFCCDVVHNVKK
jgi:hypothetical protein